MIFSTIKRKYETLRKPHKHWSAFFVDETELCYERLGEAVEADTKDKNGNPFIVYCINDHANIRHPENPHEVSDLLELLVHAVQEIQRNNRALENFGQSKRYWSADDIAFQISHLLHQAHKSHPVALQFPRQSACKRPLTEWMK